MNFIEGLPKSKGKLVTWVVVDMIMKYAHFLPLSYHYSIVDVAKRFLDNVYKLHGFSSSIINVGVLIFMNNFWKDFFRLHGVEHKHSTSYHPQIDS